MKKYIALLAIFALILLPGVSQGQDSTPTPAPIDNSIFVAPVATPTPTPVPLTGQPLVNAQAQFVRMLSSQLPENENQIERIYVRCLQFFAPSAQLTTAQKLAAMNEGQRTAVLTMAWQLYNLIKQANPNANVPAPSVALP